MSSRNILRRNIKDTVFSDLFKNKKNLLLLYRVLHPEDVITKENELDIVTVRNVLINAIYNDLGFTVNDRLIILVEAQSLWTENILVRMLSYLARTYMDYLTQTDQNPYSSRKVRIPKPELYVIYSGEKVTPEEISFSDEFFNGEACAVDIKVKVLRGGIEGNILDQYVAFTKVCSEQVELYGRSKDTVLKIIDICKDRNILKEYLRSREQEVVDIMMNLYENEQEIAMQFYLREQRKEERVQTAKRMLKRGRLTYEEIAEYSGLILAEVESLAREIECRPAIGVGR